MREREMRERKRKRGRVLTSHECLPGEEAEREGIGVELNRGRRERGLFQDRMFEAVDECLTPLYLSPKQNAFYPIGIKLVGRVPGAGDR
jgi:hypothetical protein